MLILSMNKKGQFEDKLLAIIIIFVIAVILIFFNLLNDKLYTSLDNYFNDSEKYNDSLARKTVQDIQGVDNSVWDWAFLGIFVALIIQIILFSFATQVHLAFYWILMLLDIPLLIMGVVLSNTWQTIAVNPTMAESIARFPITNMILGSYYPMVVVVIIFLSSIILFGKRLGG